MLNRVVNYIFWSWRINRTQFFLLLIFFLFVFWIIKELFLYFLFQFGFYDSYYSVERIFIIKRWFTVDNIISSIIYFIFLFPIIQRRGNDIKAPKLVSYIFITIYTVLFFTYFWFLSLFVKIILFCYLFLPGNKTKNKYWEIPENTWNFRKIIKKMWLSKN